MTGYARFAATVSVFLVLAALGMLPACQGSGPPSGSTSTALNASCDDSCDCSAYRGCVEGGDIWCEFNRCRTNGRVGDLTCVDRVDRFCTPSMPPPAADAGVSTVLPYQARTCTWTTLRPSTALYEFGWIDVIADSAGSTFELMRANVLGVRADGTIVPIQGSALGAERPFTFYANYIRDPWFDRMDFHEPAAAPTRTADAWVFTVPANRVLHIVLGGERVDAYREAYMMVQARTTGTVRYSVGLDYDSNLSVDDGGRERRPFAGFSNWGSSPSPGADITLSNPISTEPNFCGFRPIMASPTPPTTSREFVFEPGSVFRTADTGSSFYCSSGWVTTIWGPTEAQNLVSSPGGSIRSSAPYAWPSFGALTMYCDARRDWVDWRPWRGRPVTDITGFGTLTMCGTDIRPLAVIGTEAYPKPIINWGSARAPCP